MPQTPTPSASEIDQHVGEQIRRRRILLGLTQDQLGEELGISYQQIQKYETGANRVSAGRLFQIAGQLNVSVSDLYSGLESGAITSPSKPQADLSVRQVAELVRAFSHIDENHLRLAVLSLVRAMGRPDAASEIGDIGAALATNPPQSVELAPKTPDRSR